MQMVTVIIMGHQVSQEGEVVTCLFRQPHDDHGAEAETDQGVRGEFQSSSTRRVISINRSLPLIIPATLLS